MIFDSLGVLEAIQLAIFLHFSLAVRIQQVLRFAYSLIKINTIQ